MLSLHVVPELGLGKHRVTSENSHSVESRVGVLLSGETSANDEELSHLHAYDRRAELTFACMDSTPTPLTISFNI